MINYKEGARLTVDFESESYLYGEEYFESWDSYGEEMADAVNKLLEQSESKPLDLHKDFAEWDKLITRLDKNSRRLMEIDEIYQECSDNLLAEARKLKEETGTDVIKNKYGANNDKVRRQYVDEQEHITKLLKEKQELEFIKADDNRRISFVKKIIDMKIQLIRYSD